MAETLPAAGPEAVAYALMRDIALAEGVALGADRTGAVPADRAWILATFTECLHTVKAEPLKAAPTHGRSSF